MGGKNASLGEMISQLSPLGVRVPGGFATTAAAFRDFLSANQLASENRRAAQEPGCGRRQSAGCEAGATIRRWVVDAPFPAHLDAEVRKAYTDLCRWRGRPICRLRCARRRRPRICPTLPFAGQQETFLNIHGIDNLLAAIKRVFASLCTTTARSPTASTRASATRMWRSPPAFSAWCAATSAPRA